MPLSARSFLPPPPGGSLLTGVVRWGLLCSVGVPGLVGWGAPGPAAGPSAAPPVPTPPALGGQPPPGPSENLHPIVPAQPWLSGRELWWLLLAAALLVVAGLLLAAWWWRRSRRGRLPGALTPRETALQQLESIRRRLDGLDARAFGNEVSDTLRVYFVAQHGLRPDRQTSSEFLESIRRTPLFSDRAHRWLTEFLERCDLLKFAREDETLAGKERLLALAHDLVTSELTVPTPAVPPPPALPAASQPVRTA